MKKFLFGVVILFVTMTVSICINGIKHSENSYAYMSKGTKPGIDLRDIVLRP